MVVLCATGASLVGLSPASTLAAPRSTKACARALNPPESRPRRVPGPVSADLSSILGVLRRPNTAADALPRPSSLSDLSDLRAVYIDRVRMVGVLPDGAHVFLIPGRPRRPPHVSRACLRSFPRRERRLVEQELRILVRRARHATFTLLKVSDDGSNFNTSGGYDAATVERGQTFSVSSSIFRALTTVDGVVPDGVAQVSVNPPGGQTQTVAVASNYFVAQLAVRLGEDPPLTFTWRSADGRPIKTIPARRAQSGPSFGGSGSSGSSYARSTRER